MIAMVQKIPALKKTSETLESSIHFPTQSAWITSQLNIHDVIKPLYYLSRATNIWSYKYKSNNEITSLTIRDKIIASAVISVYILSFCWSLYEVSQSNMANTSTALLITEIIYLIFIHSLAIYSVMLMNSTFGELTKKFYLEFDHIGKNKEVFSTTTLYERLRQRFLLEITIVISVTTGQHLFEIFLNLVYTDYLPILVNITLYLTHLIFVIVYCQITTKVVLLFESFLCINSKLSNWDLFEKNSYATRSEPQIQLKSEHVKVLCQMHGRLCNLIHVTNDTHGWQIVLMVFTVVAIILHYLFLGIIYIPTFKWNATTIWIKIVVFMLYYGSLMIVLAARCSATRKQALKTGLLANEILLEMELNDSDKSTLIYKERLQLLIEQISYRNPHFSAGGVFSVDYTTVSTIATAITTYLIVFLQFIENPVCNFITNGINITQVQ